MDTTISIHRLGTRAEWLDQVARFASDVVGPATAGT